MAVIDGGNGTIYSFIATQFISTLLNGRPYADAAIYAFESWVRT